MARIFRFSGYLVCDRETTAKELESYFDTMPGEWWQQFHIEQSEEFTLNGESSSNCDLALLTRHFKADNISTEFDRPLPRKGEKYKHFKIGKIVTVIGISREVIMVREETVKIIRIMCDCYPNYKPNNLSETVDVWNMMLENYSYEQVSVALKAYINSDTSGFAPSIGQLIGKIQTISQPQELDGMAAWGLVSKALRNGTYGAVEEFNKLPPLVRQAVGMPDNLKNWATSDYQTIETVIQSNFLRTYETVVKRANEINRMPDDIKSLIEKTNANSYKAQIEQKFQRDMNTLQIKENALIGQNTSTEEYIEVPKEIQDRIDRMRG